MSQQVELMTKRQDLCLQRRSRPEQSDQRQPNQAENISRPPTRSPLSISAETSATMARNGVRSPSFEDVAASASVTNERRSLACMLDSPIAIVGCGSPAAHVHRPTVAGRIILFMRTLLEVCPHKAARGLWCELKLDTNELELR